MSLNISQRMMNNKQTNLIDNSAEASFCDSSFEFLPKYPIKGGGKISYFKNLYFISRLYRKEA